MCEILEQLPVGVELQLRILEFLDHYDFITLDENPNLKHLTYESRLIRLNFSDDVRFAGPACLTFIETRKNQITNINFIDWISAQRFTSTLKNLIHLESLHIIDTKLTNERGIDLASTYQNLKELSITFRWTKRCNTTDKFKVLKALTHLTLHIKSKPNYSDDYAMRFEFLHKWKNLKYLRAMAFGGLPQALRLDIISRKLEKVELFHDHFIFDDRCVSFISNGDYPCTAIYKKPVDSFNTMLRENDNGIWRDYLNNVYHLFVPFDIDVIDALQRNQPFDTIPIQELNFGHKACGKSLQASIRNILLSPRVKSLKKVAISYCILQAAADTDRTDDETTVDILSKISANCSRLRELEMWGCDFTYFEQQICPPLDSIINFKQLNRLVLFDIPDSFNASCLINICKTRKLRSLTVSNERLQYSDYLTQALQHCKSLRDLRLENVQYPDQILRVCIEYKLGLQRLSIQTVEEFVNEDILIEFLKKCESLRFVSIDRVGYELNQLCHEIRPDVSFYFGFLIHKIAAVHHFDMLAKTSKICNVDIFNGF